MCSSYACAKNPRTSSVHLHEWENTKQAMDVIGISAAEQKDILRTLSGILHLGNIEFSANGDASKVQNEDALKLAAKLLGIGADALKIGLVKRKLKEVFKDHTIAEAQDARDAFAKTLYGLIFEWLVSKINVSLGSKSGITSKNKICILDIFGFESFEYNSFEQLCINYCNEKLQNHFNHHIFGLEQKIYKEEGINLAYIEFSDNSDVL